VRIEAALWRLHACRRDNAGFKGEKYRSTDRTIFVCAEGQGSTKIGDQVFEWGQNDVFVVPSWVPFAHSAAKESVVFSISDRPAQESLGIWREDATRH
jgi:gentisate 1,2-dioxygenase